MGEVSAHSVDVVLQHLVWSLLRLSSTKKICRRPRRESFERTKTTAFTAWLEMFPVLRFYHARYVTD